MAHAVLDLSLWLAHSAHGELEGSVPNSCQIGANQTGNSSTAGSNVVPSITWPTYTAGMLLVAVGFTYLSRVENERLNFGDYPSDDLIHRLADALDADEEELLILAKRIPEPVKKRFLQRPDAFRAFATCDDAILDKLMVEIGQTPRPRKVAKKAL